MRTLAITDFKAHALQVRGPVRNCIFLTGLKMLGIKRLVFAFKML